VVPLAGGRINAAPIARRLAKEAGLDLATITGTGPEGRITEVDVAAAKAASLEPKSPVPSGDVAASPIARRLAKERGIDLATVTGTGPGGRITKEDVEGAEAAAATAPKATPSPGAGEVIPMRGMRKVIAQRMHASLADMAQLTLGADVTMDEAVKLRTQLVTEWEPEGVRPTYTDLIIKAVAKSLLAHPRVNSQITDAGIELQTDVHVGLAVALDDGLVVPVIRNAGTMPLHQIAIETTKLATAARDGKLGPDEMSGSTFSVTSLGPGVVDFFTPIINPPNVAILGVGRIRDGIRWDGDTPRKCQEMTLSLTIDHRALDGTPAAAFLANVRDLLEAPYRLLV
jgi:pyruvate/2-oxoglutarate dehydrogenase complex dihydrolipoamide acyltransferase (E2) component